MQVRDLDGIVTNWTLTGNIVKASGGNKSNLHLLARDMLKKVFPTMQVLEEVTVYIRRSDHRYLDFYVPLIKTCVEVHGEQHYNFTPFYHANMLAFLKAQKKDREKKEWCEMNDITYIELPYNQIDQWEQIISDAKNS